MTFLKISLKSLSGGGWVGWGLGGGDYSAINGITTGSWRISRIVVQMLFHKFYEQNQPIVIKDFEELILPVTHSKLDKHQRSRFRFP